MGNEKSALNGLQIEEKPVEIRDFWIHKTATVDGYNPRKVSIFSSEPSLHHGASFGKPSPLERAAKNLMLHRHPCILKYVSSWAKGSKFFLTTEQVKPLIQVIQTQSTLQICIGLCSILRALIFLHENAFASHNNVCVSSICITPEGCWKLSGLEYLSKFGETTATYFQKIKTYRCDRSVSPNEDITTLITQNNVAAIDVYAFGALAEDILRSRDSADVPGLAEFKEFCKENLQNLDPHSRSTLSNILRHPFFTHDFMRIHAFMEELPLKNDTEKEAFFENLVIQLRVFPESIIAKQLGRLLLSRIVLLDSTAQKKLVPFVLIPKGEKNDTESSLFTIPVFKIQIVPKLLEMFCIRDASIRLVLLSHFHSYVNMFQLDELKGQILPELLVGIKDTNDHLVCATLRALADVVPILGAATVIGGNRGKLFTDGRPNRPKDKVADCIGNFIVPSAVSISNINLPERPSPDGGEDKRERNFSFTEEDCTWSDWEVQEANCDSQERVLESVDSAKLKNLTDSREHVNPIELTDSPQLNDAHSNCETPVVPVVPVVCSALITARSPSKSSDSQSRNTPSQADILDKSAGFVKPSGEEYDYFTDMEPVIQKTQVLHIEESSSTGSIFDVKATLNSTPDGLEESIGWEEDLSDWGSDDNPTLKA